MLCVTPNSPFLTGLSRPAFAPGTVLLCGVMKALWLLPWATPTENHLLLIVTISAQIVPHLHSCCACPLWQLLGQERWWGPSEGWCDTAASLPRCWQGCTSCTSAAASSTQTSNQRTSCCMDAAKGSKGFSWTHSTVTREQKRGYREQVSTPGLFKQENGRGCLLAGEK